jgi:hypothetical protein
MRYFHWLIFLPWCWVLCSHLHFSDEWWLVVVLVRIPPKSPAPMHLHVHCLTSQFIHLLCLKSWMRVFQIHMIMFFVATYYLLVLLWFHALHFSYLYSFLAVLVNIKSLV